MNFFRSILSDDPDPPNGQDPHYSGADPRGKQPQDDAEQVAVSQDSDGVGWSFGGLMKTLATRSESVLETYHRDLQEFGSGLRKETETIREVASRAVKNLPASIEAGTSAAHGVLDGVLKSTADIVSKEAQSFRLDGETETSEVNRGLKLGRYSWFEAQLNAIQGDSRKFCEEPEDVEDFKKWKLGFGLENNRDEIEELSGENGILEGVYKKVVPSAVDHETFWCRYFYRVDKLKQQEKVRANLVKRATSIDTDEDLSWDVDGEDENDGKGVELMRAKGGDGDEAMKISGEKSNSVKKGNVSDGGLQHQIEGSKVKVDDDRIKNNVIESSEMSGKDMPLDEKKGRTEEIAAEKLVNEVKPEEIVKNDEGLAKQKDESGKISEPTVSTHQQEMEEKEEDEDELGWDEIEDIGSGDENKISTAILGERRNRVDVRRRLSTAEDDEDLSWDIEDDDEPVKS